MLKLTVNELIDIINEKKNKPKATETFVLSQHKAQSLCKAIFINHVACSLVSKNSQEVIDALEELIIAYARNIHAYMEVGESHGVFLLPIGEPTLKKYNAEIDILAFHIAKEKPNRKETLNQIFGLVAYEFQDIYNIKLEVEEGGE